MNDILSSSVRGEELNDIKTNYGEYFILEVRRLWGNPAKLLDLVDSIANDPVKAIKVFGAVLTPNIEENLEFEYKSQSDPRALALAMQGFGKISHLETKKSLAFPGTPLSVNLLYILQQEAQSNNARVRWSALHAINKIWFHEEWQKREIDYGMAVSLENVPRLEQGVIEEQLRRLDSYKDMARESNTGSGLSSDYQDWRDFWVYGAVDILVNIPKSGGNYHKLVTDVLEHLSYRGVEAGLKVEPVEKYTVLEIALEIASGLFFENAQDVYMQQRLYDIPELLRLLRQDNTTKTNIDLRKLAAEALRYVSTAIDDYKSDNGSVKETRARSLVICEEWAKAAKCRIDAIPSLLDVAMGRLHLRENNKSTAIWEDRCKAIKILGEFFSEILDLDVQRELCVNKDWLSFLSYESNLDLRKLVAKYFRNVSTKLDADYPQIKEKRARCHVIYLDWQSAINCGVDAVPSLLDVATERLHLYMREENLILESRWKAVESLGRIKYERSQKISDLAQFLLDKDPKIRKESLGYLGGFTRYMSSQDPQYTPLENIDQITKNKFLSVYFVVKCLLYKATKDKYEFHYDSTMVELEEIKEVVKELCVRFEEVTSVAKENANILGDYYRKNPQYLQQSIDQKFTDEMNKVRLWLGGLEKDIQILQKNHNAIKENNILLEKVINLSKNLDENIYRNLSLISMNCNENKEIDDMTYNECQKIYNCLNDIKRKYQQSLKESKRKRESEPNKLKKVRWTWFG